MIFKNNSKDLMDRFHNAEDSIESIKTDLNNLITLHKKRSSVIEAIQLYDADMIQKIIEQTNNASNISNKIVFSLEDNIASGKYGVYGQTIHPAFVSEPDNIFNFKTSEGYVYKNNGIVSINDTIRPEYRNILKHDSIEDLYPIFDEYDTDTIKLKIEFDSTGVVADKTFNVIELSPFLQGSFNIVSMEIEQDNALDSSTITYENINSVANMRICLSNKTVMKSITLNIKLLYQNTGGKYLFGMKHIYFYNADYASSYIVYNFKLNQYIDSISDKITFHTQFANVDTSCTQEGIKIYLYLSGGTPSYEIALSSNSTPNDIGRNTKNLYVYVPLNTSIISMEFDSISLR